MAPFLHACRAAAGGRNTTTHKHCIEVAREHGFETTTRSLGPSAGRPSGPQHLLRPLGRLAGPRRWWQGPRSCCCDAPCVLWGAPWRGLHRPGSAASCALPYIASMPGLHSCRQHSRCRRPHGQGMPSRRRAPLRPRSRRAAPATRGRGSRLNTLLCCPFMRYALSDRKQRTGAPPNASTAPARKARAS